MALDENDGTPVAKLARAYATRPGVRQQVRDGMICMGIAIAIMVGSFWLAFTPEGNVVTLWMRG